MKGGGGERETDLRFSFQKRRFRLAPFTDYVQENPIHRDNFDFYGTMRDLQRRESASGYIRSGISSTRSPVKRFESTSVSLTYKSRLISRLTRYSASAAANQEEINGVYVTIGIFHLFNWIKTAGVKLNECVPENFFFFHFFFFFFLLAGNLCAPPPSAI